MLIDVEPLTLDFRRNPQTDEGFHYRADDRSCHNRKQNGDPNRFQLLEPK